MAETLFVRLSDTGTATWGAFDATGRLAGVLGRGTLQAAHAALAGRRCTALVNAVDVLTAEAALPAASQARLRQIAPFSLEESLANDVDEMAFAIGARLPSGATQVAAVAKERMDAWLGELARRRHRADTRCAPKPMEFPTFPSTLVLLIEGERIAGRKPGRAPFVFEGLRARRKCWRSRSRRKADEPELRHIRVFTDAAGHARFADGARRARRSIRERRRQASERRRLPASRRDARATAGNELAARRVRAEVQLARAGETLARRRLARWPPPSCWACCCKAPNIGSCAAPTPRSTRSSAPACQRVVGDSSTSGCQREVRQRLGDERRTGDGGFLEHARGDRGGARCRRCVSMR